MNIKEVATVIKDRVTMKDVLDFYCLNTKHDFMPCPFHNEKEPSLKVYKSGWYCFGCHSGGSVIDFVMRKESCSFSTAVSAINYTFRLGLLENHDPLDEDKIIYTRLIDELARVLLEEISLEETGLEELIIAKLKLVQDIEAKPVPERAAGEWSDLYQCLEEMNYLEYKKEQCNELRSEVNRWKKNYHRISFQNRTII